MCLLRFMSCVRPCSSTVHPSICRYTAELKRPVSQPREHKVEAVEELLDVLALKDCRSVRIGK